MGSTFAQVGFGTSIPDRSAEVEVQATDKGLLIPRVVLNDLNQKLKANINNANALLVYNIGSNLPNGFYYWKANIVEGTDNGIWVAMGAEAPSLPKFFYMPSVIIDTGVNGTFKRNLFAEYIAQFTGKQFIYDPATGGSVSDNIASNKFIKSTGAPNVIPNIPKAIDLFYYVTDFDNTALSNLSIDANGILTYTVVGTGTDYSFVNIVFVVK